MAYAQEATFTERMREKVELSESRSALVKQSYMMLSLAVVAAMFGGYVGASVEPIRSLFTGWIGWILAMVLINFLPRLAIKTANNPTTGLLSLLAYGFVAGAVLGPILWVVGMMATGASILMNALVITALVFGAVSFVVWTSGKKFSAPKNLMTGLFIGISAAVLLSFIAPLGPFGLLISVGIGVFGVLSLVFSTSELLHNDTIDSPIIGAVMLFAGVFMIFQSVLHLLMAFAGGDD